MITKKLLNKTPGRSATLTYQGRCDIADIKNLLRSTEINVKELADELEKILPARYVTKEQIVIWKKAMVLRDLLNQYYEGKR
jgi:hypothetical protein